MTPTGGSRRRMTHERSSRLVPELHNLFDRLQDDDFSENDRLRLNELLAAGDEQRRCFITYADIHSWLAWEGMKKTPSEERLVRHPAATVFPCPRLPRQRGTRHTRLYLLGLAAGVSGGNDDFRGWASDRLPHLRVPARAGCPAIRLSSLSSLASPQIGRPDHRHDQLPMGKGSVSGFRVQSQSVSNPESLIPNPLFSSATSSPWLRA